MNVLWSIQVQVHRDQNLTYANSKIGNRSVNLPYQASDTGSCEPLV
jgi:hypothetical protein